MKDLLDAPARASEAALDWNGVAFRTERSADAGGASILEATARPGFGPPRPALLDSAVTLVVTQGEIELWVEGALRRVAAGQSATVPAGATHAFRAVGPGPSRHLHVVATRGLEAFLRGAAAAGAVEIRGPMLGSY